jgi:hypothetical protein
MAAMATEHNHLAQAISHIAQGEQRVREQRALVARLADHGHDTTLAELLLDTMQTSLNRMNDHRQLIEQAIATGRK